MKKFLIAAATLATAVSAAAPAAAQWYPQQSQYGYASQYGNAYNQYGYGNGSQLQQRVQTVRRDIRLLDRSNRLSQNEARQLDRQAQFLQQRIQRLAYGGFNQNERYYVERQIAQLEQQVRREANDGNGWYGQNRAYGYNGYTDRDHDGRDDGQEHQRWHDNHDGNHDDDND